MPLIISVREIHERPIYVEIGKKNGGDNFSVAKINLFEFSSCGQYLAVKHELYPTTLWIWDIFTDYLDYLLLENPISGMLLKYQSTPFLWTVLMYRGFICSHQVESRSLAITDILRIYNTRIRMDPKRRENVADFEIHVGRRRSLASYRRQSCIVQLQ